MQRRVKHPKGELQNKQHQALEKIIADRHKRQGIYRKGADSRIRRRLDELAKREGSPSWKSYVESRMLERELGRLEGGGVPTDPEAATFYRRVRSRAHPLAPGAGMRINIERRRLIRNLEAGRYGPAQEPRAREAIVHLGRDVARYAVMAEIKAEIFRPTPDNPAEAEVERRTQELNAKYGVRERLVMGSAGRLRRAA